MRCAILIALVLLPCVAQGTNLALNKPAFQSSTYPTGLASRAVDGNDDPQWSGASCSHTMGAGNEWWAVDLGAVSNINSVRITNRADCCSERLTNFKVGLTNISPEEQAPAVGNYEECATVTERVAAGEKKLVKCAGTGRYLVIQLIPKQALTLCEVEVFGEVLPEPEVLIEELYIGCFRDAGDRALPTLASAGSDNTPEACVEQCKAEGHRFAGVQYSSECWCGSTFDKHGPADNCNMECSGDGDEICGGSWAQNVYATDSEEEILEPQVLIEEPQVLIEEPEVLIEEPEVDVDELYIGCFRDTGDRALPARASVGSVNTPEACVEQCKAEGHKFAGVQYSSECWCGSTYDKHGPADNCNMECSGDDDKICGGSWAQNVYATDSDDEVLEQEHEPEVLIEEPEPEPEVLIEEPEPEPEVLIEEPEVVVDPVPEPEPEPITCPKQRTKFAENGLDVEPVFTEDCQFALKQCNEDRCYCVSAKNGKRTYKNAEVPLGESYGCDFKVKNCLKTRFKAIFKQQKTGETPDYLAVCSKKGKYEKKQCNNSGECWCAKPNKGKEIKKTRTTEDLKC